MNQTVLTTAQNPPGFSQPGSTAWSPVLRAVCGCRRITRCRAMQAFTLVEVTLALGIISFAFTVMLGMIPVGLKTARKAMEASTGSQIVQRIVAQVKQTDFQNLVQMNYTFDDQANEATGNNAPKIYDARVTISKDVTLPGCSKNTNLARVTIEIANNPGRSADPFATNGTDGRPNVKVYSAYIARSTPGS